MNWKLIALVVALLAIPGCGVGCIGAIGIAAYLSQGGATVPEIVPSTDEEQVWSVFADFIQEHPDRFDDTDRVYKIGEELKRLGKVSSTARLSEFAAKMQPITSSNREQVVAKVRGK